MAALASLTPDEQYQMRVELEETLRERNRIAGNLRALSRRGISKTYRRKLIRQIRALDAHIGRYQAELGRAA